MNNNIVKHLISVLTGILLAVIILHFVGPTLVNGDSMSPSLENGDFLLMNKDAHSSGDLEYGDIVVFPNGEKNLIKRVIGKPGDAIEIKGGKVYRNGSAIEDYTTQQTEPDVLTLLGNDEVFVLGDNREVSLDSRYPEVGNVKITAIKGKAFFRLKPNFGSLQKGNKE